MKKTIYCLILPVILLVFFGCSTKLEITNDTSTSLDLIYWTDQDGKIYWFGNDAIWDSILGEYVNGLYPKSSDEKKVEPGDSPVFFFFPFGVYQYRTLEIISVDKWKKESYVFTDYTMVIGMGNEITTLKKESIGMNKNLNIDKNEKLQKYFQMKEDNPRR